MRLMIFLFLILSSQHSWSTVSAAVYDITQDRWIHNQAVNQTRPIASITKLMTVMVSMDHDADLDRKITVKRATAVLEPGAYTRRTLITAVLVRSDNRAAELLSEQIPGGTREFLRAMNRKAAELMMFSTEFRDASGLSAGNVSTVQDVITMLRAADLYPIIRSVSTQAEVRVPGRNKKIITIINTNRPVLVEYTDLTVSKTGFTSQAGWCMALMVVKHGTRTAVVILGADSKQARLNQIQQHLDHHGRITEPQVFQPNTVGDHIRTWMDAIVH